MSVDNVFHYFAADGRECFPILKNSNGVCDEPVPWEFSTFKRLLEDISKAPFGDSRSGADALFVFSSQRNSSYALGGERNHLHGGDSIGTQA